METGESSVSNSSDDDIWAKLVPLESDYSDIELKSNEVTVISEIKISSCEKQEWCKITREKDQVYAIMQNKSSSLILVDGSEVQEDDSTIIRCGSEIILGPDADGFMRYMFKVMPRNEIFKKQLQVSMDHEHAKCSICLNVWHDVVTLAPCLHNFCNGCFSEWLKRCQQRHSTVLCPQCRAVVQFVGRNHFLHNIEEIVLQADPSLRRPEEEIAVLDSISSIKSPLTLPPPDEEAGSEDHDSDNGDYPPSVHETLLPSDEEADVGDHDPDRGDYPPFVHELTTRLDSLNTQITQMHADMNRRFDNLQASMNALLQHFQIPLPPPPP